MEFKSLFSEIKVGKITVKNRIVMPALHLGYADDNGMITDRHISFYRERAKGGAGLIIVGGAYPERLGRGYLGMIGISGDEHIPGLEKLAETIKAHNCKVGVQLLHVGRYGYSRLLGEQSVSASPIPSKLTRETPRELATSEVEEVVKNYGKAAARAQKAGFDLVEVLAAGGYLPCQFLSPLTNKRKDKYGGDLEGRMTFLLEVVAAIKDHAPKLTLGVRLSGDEFMDGGIDHIEMQEVARALDRAGVEVLNITGGWHETDIPQITMHVPEGAYVYLAQGIKKSVNVPVIASNRINSPCLADRIVSRGWADLVVMGRGLIADPELPIKAQEGRVDEINTCIACNQGCLDHVFLMKPITCLVNPRAGRETEFALSPAKKKKAVVVVGGGPAGMEAARVAALRGHDVTLAEKGERLGGQFLLAASAPNKHVFLEAIRYLSVQLENLGVKVHKNTVATPDWVKELNPDVVVVATGSRPIIPAWAKDKPNVTDAWQVLSENIVPGHKTVVVGGGAVGCETALFLSRNEAISTQTGMFLMEHGVFEPKGIAREMYQYRDVILLEMEKRIGADIGLSIRWTILQELKRHGVDVRVNTKVTEIVPEGVVVQTEGGKEDTIPADTVVLAVGVEPLGEEFVESLKGIVPEVIIIGDAKQPGKAIDAIFDGLKAGSRI
nr:FAD-dependent oxidoreductase [Desulfobacterales bacterium]